MELESAADSSSCLCESSSSCLARNDLGSVDFDKLARGRGAQLVLRDKLAVGDTFVALGTFEARLADDSDMFFLSDCVELLDMASAPVLALDNPLAAPGCSPINELEFEFMCAAMFDLYNRSNTEVLLRLWLVSW